MATSLNPYISCFDEGFDVGKTPDYRMTIQFALGGFSYVIAEDASQSIVAMEAYLSDALEDESMTFEALLRALEMRKLAKKEFRSVTFLIQSRCNTLIPAPVFEEKESQTLLGLVHPLPQNPVFLNDPISACDGVNLYAIPGSLSERVKAYWKNAEIMHESSVFLISLIKNKRQEDEAYVYVRNRNFDMAVIKDGRLTFFNNFKFTTKDDFLYFLLFALEQQGLHGNETTVRFAGMILGSSEIMQLCQRYVKQTLFQPCEGTLQVSKALKEIPSQYYYIPYQILK